MDWFLYDRDLRNERVNWSFVLDNPSTKNKLRNFQHRVLIQGKFGDISVTII